ncbi:MAG: glycosyltransferase, partial [Gemmatimonadaceae bacterium]|nr:glycosyltransferase [Gemmatimonadaceae bacterium]
MTAITPSPRSPAPVFLDESGRRWRRIRLFTLIVGVVSSLAAAAVVIGLLVPPLPPALPLSEGRFGQAPHLAVSKLERERLAKRLQLWFELRKHHAPPSIQPDLLPLKGRHRGGKRAAPGQAIVAGFYVNWDDNSFAALKAHADDLDWIICEWASIAPGGDSLRMRIDRRVPYTLAQQFPDERQRPRLFLMVENYDSTAKPAPRWSPGLLRHMLATPAARARAIAQLQDSVLHYGLEGVTLDFEEVPPDLTGAVAAFARDLKARLAPYGRLVTQAVSFNDTDRELARYAAVDDKLFLMLYDEHYGKGDPGPVASQSWYVRSARRLLRVVPPSKAILTIGAYGYDWNDGDTTTNGAGLTFQEVMAHVRDAQQDGLPAAIHFDSAALNPYATWRDPDSTDHVAWYLDAVTAYNQILAGEALGVAGHAVWRLGAEDPAIWSVLGRTGIDAPAQRLAIVPPGYDVEFQPTGSTGEILEMRARPTAGRRTVRVDPVTRLVTDERVTSYATPYIIRRYGDSPHRVALTFDDGPDGRWTPQILDTLASRHAPATFFIVGENAEAHLPLLRRIWNEGHEIGNHTFTHPNLGIPSPYITKLTKLQLDATERLVEAILDRRTAFFRPPYFGDAEPTTADELVPVGIASDRGYLTVGLRIDAEDWQSPGVRTIIDTVLAQRWRGNVILLHDGGGNRSQTVAALGPLIDSLRARGDTLVTVSELVGIPRDLAMPPLPARSWLARAGDLFFFGAVGFLEWGMYWIFMGALVLGVARLLFITTLAVVQRLKRHQDPGAAITYAPPVSVIVPAYREERVIVSTIRSLVTQQYPGELEVVVVDDGSPDATYEVARAAFGDHPRVSIYRKPNGGKASALNYGLARARGEIVICLDADTIFAPNTVAELVEPLHDPTVGAVAGNAKVGNRVNLVTRWQAVEYVTSQNLDRRAFSLLNCITVVPGAVGA